MSDMKEKTTEFLFQAGSTLLFLGGVIIFYKGLDWLFSLI